MSELEQPGSSGWNVLAEWGSYPQWIDDRQRVEARMRTGGLIEGMLVANDSRAGIDEEELPIFTLVADDDTEVSLAAIVEWRLKP